MEIKVVVAVEKDEHSPNLKVHYATLRLPEGSKLIGEENKDVVFVKE